MNPIDNKALGSTPYVILTFPGSPKIDLKVEEKRVVRKSKMISRNRRGIREHG